jgi:rhodanese-related sulfurtransferase
MFGLFKKKSNKMFDNINASVFEKEVQNNPDAVLLDVRTAEEFNSGHLPDAVNIDIHSPSFMSDIEKLDKSKYYLVYCRSGARSYNACNIMANSGFTKLANMMGGIMSWRGEVAVG